MNIREERVHLFLSDEYVSRKGYSCSCLMIMREERVQLFPSDEYVSRKGHSSSCLTVVATRKGNAQYSMPDI
jgi:hypothetical protein